jgi:hypothetical protein
MIVIPDAFALRDERLLHVRLRRESGRADGTVINGDGPPAEKDLAFLRDDLLEKALALRLRCFVFLV